MMMIVHDAAPRRFAAGRICDRCCASGSTAAPSFAAARQQTRNKYANTAASRSKTLRGGPHKSSGRPHQPPHGGHLPAGGPPQLPRPLVAASAHPASPQWSPQWSPAPLSCLLSRLRVLLIQARGLDDSAAGGAAHLSHAGVTAHLQFDRRVVAAGFVFVDAVGSALLLPAPPCGSGTGAGPAAFSSCGARDPAAASACPRATMDAATIFAASLLAASSAARVCRCGPPPPRFFFSVPRPAISRHVFVSRPAICALIVSFRLVVGPAGRRPTAPRKRSIIDGRHRSRAEE